MWFHVHRVYMWWNVNQLVTDDRVQILLLTILDHNPPNTFYVHHMSGRNMLVVTMH